MLFDDKYRYNSVDVAMYIVARANDEKFGINMTKLQKLLYIVYGAYLRVYSERLTNEHPQAWPYGPVFPTTRNRLLKMNLSDITLDQVAAEVKEDAKVERIATFVFGHFSTWNAGQLSEWSHQEGSPWDSTKHQPGFKWGQQIDDEVIYNYFLKIVKVDGQGDDRQ